MSVIIPNLLHYPGPAIVIDPKGENFSVTARYRKENLRQNILLLDPFCAVDQEQLRRLGVDRGRLNPLDVGVFKEGSPDTEAQMLSEIFAGPIPDGENEFWDNSAKRLTSALFSHEMGQSKASGRLPEFSKIIGNIFSEDPLLSIAKLLDNQNPSKFVLSGVGGGLLAIDADVTRAGILATAQSHLSIFNSPELLAWLDNSSISLRYIQESEDYTLYIVIPPNKLASHSILLKTWISVLMHAIMERKSKPNQKTLFILDECANLGELEVLRKAVTLLRGYGLQVWMFFQDLAQLQDLYPDSGTIINNCGVLQAFGIGRQAASEPIARIMGTLKARDLLQMDDRQQAISKIPGRPQIARLLRYYSDAAFVGRYDTNPLIPTVRSRAHPSTPVRLSTWESL